MDLEAIVRDLQVPVSPDVLVGLNTNDDAGVYRIGGGLNIVLTADFIAPTCDDPRMFGRIAAANSLSDIYAMGGEPKAALNLCCFPPSGIEKEVLTEIMRGGLEAINESGASLVGGHTVKDNELKYGLSVTGLVHDTNLKTNAGAKPGDLIVLTKPIGTGVVMAGCKQGTVSDGDSLPVMERMAQLNRAACAAMVASGADSATDVTGFGLAGHALEMATASKVAFRFYAHKIPIWPQAEALIRGGIKTGVKLGDDQFTADTFVINSGITAERRALFFDPQTSGGLLIAIPENKANELIRRLNDSGITDAAICGEAFTARRSYLEFQP